MHIGAAIRHTRETLRLKLEMVALDAGFDPGNLSRIETGRQNPSIPRLEAIARAMEVTVADLYALVEPPRTLGECAAGTSTNARGRSMDHSEWVQLRRTYEGLDAGRRQLAMNFMQMLERLQKDETVSPDGEMPSLDDSTARRDGSRRGPTAVDAAGYEPLSLASGRGTTPTLRMVSGSGESR